MLTLPESGLRKVQRTFIVVDFPAPFGPRKAKSPPGLDVKADASDRYNIAVGFSEVLDFNNVIHVSSLFWGILGKFLLHHYKLTCIKNQVNKPKATKFYCIRCFTVMLVIDRGAGQRLFIANRPVL